MHNSSESVSQPQFLPDDFIIQDWESIAPYYQRLLAVEITSAQDLLTWLRQVDELESTIQEERAWRYIRLSCNTENEQYQNAYNYFVTELAPKITEKQHEIQKKYYHSPFRDALQDERYQILSKLTAKEIELFRSENIPLYSQVEVEAQQYDSLTGRMSIEHNGKTLTLQQASVLLEENDRNLREQVWFAVNDRRLQDRDALDSLFDTLKDLRVQIANNAGFASFTDFMFKALGRFDYTQADCNTFHQAIEQVITPAYVELMRMQQTRLNLDVLRPWDVSVDTWGSKPLRPFQSGKELTEKTIQVMGRMDSRLEAMIRRLDELKHLDLDSRMGKAPGGYNYPLHKTGAPFIFMNAAGTQNDLTTMLHECGHAVHTFLTHPLELTAFKEVPSELAELASMSMELITMDNWDIFYPDPKDLLRAQIQQITRSITTLNWIATVDSFQAWIYNNANHTPAERNAYWCAVYDRFHGNLPNWDGLEKYKEVRWQRQLHIFQTPFYYIEYGFAQVGAFQVWRNWRKDPKAALDAYINGLSAGYTMSLPTVYKQAGIEFNFTTPFLQELMGFVMDELNERIARLKTLS